LIKYSQYQNDKKYDIPRFTYQDLNDKDLVEFREKYQLDSIAGKGSEVDQILNLMRWVHKTVKHDGHKAVPDKMDGGSLIELCINENRGIHCGGIAFVLNETYLSMGFKSKWITLMPYEQEFDDCHTINIVYSKNLKKWIWIDANYQTYIMDENDNLLSIEEVRDKTINNEPLKLCDEYDLDSYTAKDQGAEHYLNRYIPNLLFRFCSSTDSKAYLDYSQWTIVNLYPKGYNPKNVEFGKILDINGFKEVYIDNSEQFWKRPD
jgi:hypothetical protein